MRQLAIAAALGGIVALTACTNTLDTQQKMSEQAVIERVSSLPNSQEKRLALAVIGNPNTKRYVDRHGYPAWRWRGPDDIGSCVHIDPKSGQPYLENQFSRADRSSVPKYIDFGTDSADWQCRIHIQSFGLDYSRNWSNRACHRRGQELVKQLTAELL